MSPRAIVRSFVIAGMMFGASTAIATPIDYTLLTTIGVPATIDNTDGGAFTSFDISFADAAGYDYIADRSNASVDIINGATNTVVAQPGGFVGHKATSSTSGPDGVLVAGTGAVATLFAGDGNSNVLSFNVSNPGAPTPAFPPISTGGTFRADEMAYSPTAHVVLVANNADTPAFATLIDATTGAVVAGHITIPGSPADGGLEQPVWNPSTGSFFISVPAFNGAGNPGGVAEISPTGVALRTFDFGTMGITSCSPTGLALGGSGKLMVGCGNAKTQTILLDPAANTGHGAIADTFTGVAGSDEIWYDPTSGNFFATGTDASGTNRIFAVISDATDTLLDTTPLPNVSAHSIAVDPLNGEVFVPLAGGAADTICPIGCVAVFAPVPEPGSLPLFAFGLLGLVAASAGVQRVLRRR